LLREVRPNVGDARVVVPSPSAERRSETIGQRQRDVRAGARLSADIEPVARRHTAVAGAAGCWQAARLRPSPRSIRPIVRARPDRRESRRARFQRESWPRPRTARCRGGCVSPTAAAGSASDQRRRARRDRGAFDPQAIAERVCSISRYLSTKSSSRRSGTSCWLPASSVRRSRSPSREIMRSAVSGS